MLIILSRFIKICSFIKIIFITLIIFILYMYSYNRDVILRLRDTQVSV